MAFPQGSPTQLLKVQNILSDRNIISDSVTWIDKTKDRRRILRDLANDHFDCITAVRCLDEGVDIPSVKVAIFKASSGNPKQFIQRRGRVLRRSERTRKTHAIIYDILVTPPMPDPGTDASRNERKLIARELLRHKRFAELARNKNTAIENIQEIFEIFNLPFEDLSEEWISDKTRYACDGLLKQRLDTPYIRENGRLQKSSWDQALKLLISKLKSFNPKEIAGLVGDLADLEMIYSFKSFFEKCIGSTNFECRQDRIYLNPKERMNYIFNSSINGIEDSDLILLVGTNPRLEATILNVRIRKAYIKNRIKIYSIGDPGDLTYPYQNIGSSTSIIKEIESGSHEISKKIKKSKKPLIIIGESALYGKAGEYIFETLKSFLSTNNFIRKDWNALNILTQQASRVGSIDLGIYLINENDNYSFFNKLENNDFKFIYLLGADNISFDKKDKFIVYQGSHGDKGAEIADIILPGAAYTEKDGLFVNLEGKLQSAYKASYPPGDAREDWIIFRDLAKMIKKPLEYKNIKHLRESINNDIQLKINNKIIKINKIDFVEENISIKSIDYYYTNPIARSSKIMSDCRQISKKLLFTGIEKAS